METDPLSKSRDDYKKLIDTISLPDSPVGIDVQLTHAVIIDYLQRISTRLDALEKQLAARQATDESSV